MNDPSRHIVATGRCEHGTAILRGRRFPFGLVKIVPVLFSIDMTDSLTEKLRAATELDVAVAMEGAPFTMPTDDVELLEFYNRMLDVAGVLDADGDVFQPEG